MLEEWLDMLFVPGEVFEIRTKGAGDKGVAWRGWMEYGNHEKLVKNVLPISRTMRKNVWIGVCPRTESGSSVPSLARVVWVDCDGTTAEAVLESINALGIPAPTMVVDSGHGVHVYWQLSEAVPAEEVRPVTKWLSRNVEGSDGAAYDPTRILRVPGTRNFKEPEAECSIFLHDPERVYSLGAFPREESRGPEEHVATPTVRDTLATSEYEAIADAWVEGQRHQVALATAGYLRKKGYSEEDAVYNLLGIHFSRGGQAEDENYYDIINVCRTTYQKPLAMVEGYKGLERLGVEFPDAPTFSFPTPTSPARKPSKNVMGLIDFREELEEQEFWVDGFVGPGLLTMIAAAPKAGKSMIAMQIGHALANGQRVFDFDTTQESKRVLYFQGELSKGMVYSRAKAMFPEGTFEDIRKFGMTDKPEKILDLIHHPEPLYDLAEHYDVVIIDPLSVFNANDENSVTSVRETLAVFDVLKAQGKAVILVHHTKKLESNRDGTTAIPSTSDVRGSSAWFAAVDALAILYPWGDSGNARMKFTYRAAPERDVLNLYRLDHGGFTSSRDAYLKLVAQRGVALPVEGTVLN